MNFFHADNMNKQMTPLKADMLLLMISAAWGGGFSVTKAAVQVVSPIQFLTCRHIISAVLSILFFRKKLLNADKSDWFAGILTGIMLTVAMTVQTVGLQYTSAGKALFIASASVIMVPFFFWFVSKEKPKKKIIFAAFLMLSGLGLLSIGQEGISGINKGDLLVLIGAVSFGMLTTALGVYAPKKDPFLLSGIQLITSAALFLVIQFFDSNKLPLSVGIIPAILYASVIATFVGTIIQVVCQKYTSPNKAAIIMNLQTVFGSLIAIMFLGESYTPRMILAFAITFVAVLIAEVNFNDLKIAIQGKEQV